MFPGIAETAGGNQHSGNDEFFDRVRICPRRIEYRNAQGTQFINRNIIDAGTSPAHRCQRFRDLHVMHVVRTQDDRVGMRDLGCDLVAFAREMTQPFDRNVVER